jgi:CheY-specific phosphatase CheX
MLEGELANHLEENNASGVANLSNSKTKKTVRSLSSSHIVLASDVGSTRLLITHQTQIEAVDGTIIIVIKQDVV